MPRVVEVDQPSSFLHISSWFNSDRAGPFDGLRGICLVVVVGTHMGLPGQRHGYLALEVFFVMSGYLITRNLTSGKVGVKDFYFGRAQRLLPALLVFLGVVYLLQDVAPATEHPDDAVWVIAALSLTAWYSAAQVGWTGFLAHTWSLGVEESFYLLWPICLLFLGKCRSTLRYPFCILLALSSYGLGALLWEQTANHSISPVYYFPPARAGGILFGCAMALHIPGQIPERLGYVLRLARIRGVPLTLIAVAVLCDASSFSRQSFFVQLPITAIATLCFVAQCEFPGDRTATEARLLTLLPLRFLGLTSYSLYLWHYPMLAATRDLLNASFRVALPLRCLSFLVPGLVSFWFLERPYLRRLSARRADHRRHRPVLPLIPPD